MQRIGETDLCPREMYEKLQRETLSPFAMLSENTKGRAFPLEPCPIRTEFIRDRDRIIHCKSFRRLKHKTQVFLDPQGDHYRTRLTHTLEVSQIARTIARALRLNEDVTEAIALGHDLGHTPFGHSGEDVLNALVPGGFEHNKQSLRVVEKLENGGNGLNLTYEVRDGIVNHKMSGNPCTLEGVVVSISDRIAYVNHDIDDAIRAGILTQEDLPRESIERLGDSHGKRINTLIVDIISTSSNRPYVRFSEETLAEFNRLRDFMFDNVYRDSRAKSEEGRAQNVVEELFRYYCENVDEMPAEYRKYLADDPKERIVADYIAGMSDTYAINAFRRLFIPKGWSEDEGI